MTAARPSAPMSPGFSASTSSPTSSANCWWRRTLWVGEAIRLEANLAFIGLGVQPPTPTWGNMTREGVDVLINAPWISVYAGLSILITILSFNMLGDGVRDMIDPRLRGIEWGKFEARNPKFETNSKHQIQNGETGSMSAKVANCARLSLFEVIVLFEIVSDFVLRISDFVWRRKHRDDDILLEIKHLKTYFFTDEGVSQAVDGMDLSIRRGQTLGVIGESGCGKSVTALSILQLIASPPGKIISGEILFEGEDLLRKSKPRRCARSAATTSP